MSPQQFNRPGKAEVRAWMMQRRLAAAAPPGVDEIRRAMGWPTASWPAPVGLALAWRAPVKN